MLCLLFEATLARADGARSGDPAAAVDFGAALLQASETPGSPYFLQVDCTDHKGNRSLELFPGDAAIWNGRSQIILPPSVRSSLLRKLVERDFSGFGERYGGPEQPAKSAAPLRISCRVWISVRDLEKSSVQLAGGEQATPLTELAAELLDQAALHMDGAVTPADLQDALDKLAAGQIFPQVLRLRFLELPRAGDGEPGVLMRISGGRLSRQAYRPGRLLETPRTETLDDVRYARVIEAIREAQIAGLPVNLWSEGQVELEVQVLGHRKVVLARRFSRLEPAGQNPPQQRFDTLLITLRELAE